MTIDEFIQKLQAIDLDWELWGGSLRAQRDGLNHYHCVASAVLDDVRAFSYPATELHQKLGLSLRDSLTIVDCADHSPSDFARRFDPNVRKKLLKACKVPERKR